MPCNVFVHNHSTTMIQFFPNAAGNFPFTISLSVFASPLHSLPIHFSSCDKAKKIHSLTPASHCLKVSVTVNTSKIWGATVPGAANQWHGWNGTWCIAHILNYPLSPCIAFLQHSSTCTSSDFLKRCSWWSEVWWTLALLLIGTVLGCSAHSSICLHDLWGTPELVLSAQDELSCHSATPAAMSTRNKRWKCCP